MRRPHNHRAGFSAQHAPPLCTRCSASNAQHALGAAPLPVVIPACGPRGAAAAQGCHGSKRQRRRKQLSSELAKLRAAQLAKELASMGLTELEGAGLTVAFASAELAVEIGCAGRPGLTCEGLRVCGRDASPSGEGQTLADGACPHGGAYPRGGCRPARKGRPSRRGKPSPRQNAPRRFALFPRPVSSENKG